MTDFYSQRLKEISTKKKENFAKTKLPINKPEDLAYAEEVSGLAGMRAPAGEQPQAQGMFKDTFDFYNQDPSFKTGMDEFIGSVKTMREEVKDLNLPPEMLEKRIKGMIDQYKQQAVGSQNQQPTPQMAGAMSGVVQDPMGQPVSDESMVNPMGYPKGGPINSPQQQGVM